MATTTCPQGHASTTHDYCDTCGASMRPPAATATRACPACGFPTPDRFCEDCGYDVETGRPAGDAVHLQLSADRTRWQGMVAADGEPAFPTNPATATFELSGDEVRLGRARPGVPVDLPIGGPVADPGVSAQQCTFRRTPAGWVVVDDGSANGTWINDAAEPLADGAEHLLVAGDVIGIGAWTVLRVELT